MKFTVTYLTAFLLHFSINSEIPFTEIESAVLKQKSESLVKLGNDQMLISLFGKENSYSNQQANLVIKDFFSKNPINEFGFTFKSKENSDGSSFAIASYETKTDAFRLTFHFKKAENHPKIFRLIIEKE